MNSGHGLKQHIAESSGLTDSHAVHSGFWHEP